MWSLGESPSGGRIRFRTDSTRIAIKLSYPSEPNMRNMYAFGQTGVDLYVDDVYRSTATAPKGATHSTTVEHLFFENLPRQERELTIYLPRTRTRTSPGRGSGWRISSSTRNGCGGYKT